MDKKAEGKEIEEINVANIIQQGVEQGDDVIKIIKNLVDIFPLSRSLQDVNMSIDATLPEQNLKKVMQQLVSKTIQTKLEGEMEVLWFMQLVEGLYGANFVIGMFSDFEQDWENMASVIYKVAKIEMEIGNYDQARELAEAAIEKSTHWSDPYPRIPLMLLYGSLLTNFKEFERASMVFNMVHVILTPYMKDETAREDHFPFIHQYHVTYAAFHFLAGKYEQVVYLLDQLRDWYGKQILDTELKTMLAQSYEHLGDLERRDGVLQD